MKKLLLILLLLTPMTAHASEGKTIKCEFVHVKVGDRVFRLKNESSIAPKKNGKNLFFWDGNSCEDKNYVELEVDYVRFMLSAIPEEKRVGTFSGNFRVGISHWKESGILPEGQTAFARYIKFFKDVGIEHYTNWPVENGFYHYKNMYFVSKDSDLVTPEGTPLVVFINALGFRYYLDITVGVDLLQKRDYPPSTFKEFYHNVTQTIRNLDITPEIKGKE